MCQEGWEKWGGWTGGAGGGSCLGRSWGGAGEGQAKLSSPWLSSFTVSVREVGGFSGGGLHPLGPQACMRTVNFRSRLLPFHFSLAPLLPLGSRGPVTPAQRAWEVRGGRQPAWAPAGVAPPWVTLLGRPWQEWHRLPPLSCWRPSPTSALSLGWCRGCCIQGVFREAAGPSH